MLLLLQPTPLLNLLTTVEVHLQLLSVPLPLLMSLQLLPNLLISVLLLSLIQLIPLLRLVAHLHSQLYSLMTEIFIPVLECW